VAALDATWVKVIQRVPVTTAPKALRGVALTDLDAYVGVSSGAFVAAASLRGG
jgi:hypothetical protein